MMLYTNKLASLLFYYTTGPGAAPENFIAQPLATDNIQLSWEPPPLDRQFGIITGYFIKYQINNDTNPSDVIVSGLNATLMGLQSNTSYLVTIAAINSAGTSMISISVTVTTIPERE